MPLRPPPFLGGQTHTSVPSEPLPAPSKSPFLHLTLGCPRAGTKGLNLLRGWQDNDPALQPSQEHENILLGHHSWILDIWAQLPALPWISSW